MQKNITPQIVHESEAQRQHTRLPLPARVTIKSVEYDVRDLSPGGVGVRDVAGTYERGMVLPSI